MAARVLIAEDEPDIAESLAALLSSRGYQASFVLDGAEALARARADKPDLLLLDFRLPGLDGLSVCRQLRSSPDTKTVRVVMMTGMKGEEAGSALASGAAACLTKPFDAGKLLAVVEEVLKARS